MKKNLCNENQKTLYLDWKLNPNTDAYHLSFISKITGKLNCEKLISSGNQILSNYPVFRFQFIEEKDQLFYQDTGDIPYVKHIIIEDDHFIDSFQKKFFNQKFDLNKGENIYVTILENKYTKTTYLLIHVHHIIVDLYSFYQLFMYILPDLYSGGNQIAEFISSDFFISSNCRDIMS